MEEFGTPWFDRSNEQFNRFQILAPPFQASGAGKGIVGETGHSRPRGEHRRLVSADQPILVLSKISDFPDRLQD
jgi:hypothetical protein